MAFPEISDRDRALLRAVDAGIAVVEIAAAAGLTTERIHRILRSYGRGSGRKPRPVITAPQRATVLVEFAEHASIVRAARAGEMARSTARCIVRSAAGTPVIRTGERRSVVEARVPDALSEDRYTEAMAIRSSAEPAPINDRYLSLSDRLAIADGLRAGRTGTAIAAGIGKDKSTVSREISERSIAGIYLALPGPSDRRGGTSPARALQAGDRPAAARAGRAGPGAQDVPGADLPPAHQGLPRQREHA